MQQWEEWKKVENEALKMRNAAQLESISCTTCQSTWFESVNVYQYKAEHYVIIGQDVPTRRTGMVPYKLLRCIRCSSLLEPRITRGTDIAGNDYDSFLDTLEDKDNIKQEVKLSTIENLKAKVAELEAKLTLLLTSEEKEEETTEDLLEKPKRGRKKKNEVSS